MSTIDTNRDVLLRASVQVDGAATFNGTVTMPGSVTWPSSSGTINQVMTLDGLNQLQWTSVQVSAEFARVIITSSPFAASSATPTMLVDRTDPTVITLPAIASAGDKIYRVADISGSEITSITVQAHGSETIIGAAQFVISRSFNSITLIHDGVSRWALF